MRLRRLTSAVAAFALLVPAIATAGEVVKEGTGSVRVSLGGGTPNPILTSFRLRFTNGDHELKRVSITESSGMIDAALEDQNADDPIAFEASYLEKSSRRLNTLFGTCRGECTLPVASPPQPSGWGLVLVGFRFSRSDGGDSNIRKISIRTTSDQRAYRVEFADNGTFDYDVRVQYAWIQGEQLTPWTLTGSRTSTQRTETVALTHHDSQWRTAIRGFTFQFLNGDHHLQEMAILQNAEGQYLARFHDQNFDDPFKATVEVVTLH